MVHRTCPIAAADPNAIAIAPDLTYGQLNQKISAIRFGSKKFLSLTADPNPETFCLLFAAWRASLPVFLLPPGKQAPSGSCFKCDLSLFTSGSSGTPKIASFMRSQLFESAHTVSAALKAKPQDRWLLSLPLHHVGGLGVALRAFCSEGTLVFVDKSLPYPDRLLSAKTAFASCVPTQLYRLLKEDFPAISTHFLIGGAPLSQPLYEEALRRGLRISLTYGLTEMSSTVILSSAPFWKDHLPFLGFPLRGREILLANNEILLKGEPLFEGYGSPPQEPLAWFPRGDLAADDESHGYKILGRKDSLFFCGGENIYPEEIETALLSIPEMEQAVVVPLNDEEFGARPAAFLKTSLSKEKIISSLSSLLTKNKIPILFSPLEETNSLKPDRKKLTELMNIQRDASNMGKK